MRSISPSTGVGPDSASQHVGCRRSLSRSRPQERPLSIGGGRCRPASSIPEKKMMGDGKPRPASAASSTQSPANDMAYVTQQIHEALQQQMRLEEDRQRQLVQYRRHLRTLCDENSMLRNIIHAGEIRRRDAQVAEGTGLVLNGSSAQPNSMGRVPATVTEAEIDVLSQRIYLARHRHNRILHEIALSEAALNADVKAQESLHEQSQETLDPAKLLMGANRSVYLRMMRLEQILNKLLSKQGIAGVVLSSYRYHLKTLRSEATQYDVQQTLLDKEYANLHRDHLQLVQLHGTARTAYLKAAEDLRALRASAASIQKLKEKALQHKRREVEKELVATQHQERRVVDLQHQLEEEAQSLEAAENMKSQLEWQRINRNVTLTGLRPFASSQEDTAESRKGSNGADATVTDEREAAYGVAFRDMMRLAKVSTLDDLIKVYQAEVDQQNRLEHELDHLRETQGSLQRQVQQLREREKQCKYCVGAGTQLLEGTWAPNTVDTVSSHLMERELQAFVQEEKTSLVKQVGANEASHSLLREVAERVNRLAELVAEYRSDVQVAPVEMTPALIERSSTLPLHVAVVAQKLLALAADTAQAAGVRPFNSITPTVQDTECSGDATQRNNGTSSATAVVSSTQLQIPANNRRVSLTGDSAGGRGCGGRHGRAAADVAGISSSAARALLYSHGAAHAAREGNAAWSSNPRYSPSFGAAGAHCFKNPESEDDVSLVTAAARPPSGGRVPNFDDVSTEISEAYSSSGDAKDTGSNGGDMTRDSENHSRTTASPRGSRRMSLPRSRLTRAGTGVALQASMQARAREMEDDREDPLLREEVKRMSEQIRYRQKLNAAKRAR